LSICKDVVEAAGGQLELHSADGGGTTAIVNLPAASEDVASASGRTPRAEVLH